LLLALLLVRSAWKGRGERGSSGGQSAPGGTGLLGCEGGAAGVAGAVDGAVTRPESDDSSSDEALEGGREVAEAERCGPPASREPAALPRAPATAATSSCSGLCDGCERLAGDARGVAASCPHGSTSRC